MTTSFPPINYPNKPVPPFSAPAPRNLFPGFFPDMWKNITGKPYITVSSKGLANGLSEYFNDGADFGPDSVQADGSLTQSGGVNEAIAYAKTNNINEISVSGKIKVTGWTEYNDASYGKIYVGILLPYVLGGSNTDATIFGLHIHGQEGGIPNDSAFVSTFIYNPASVLDMSSLPAPSSTDTSNYELVWTPSNANYAPSGLSLIWENIDIISPPNPTWDGLSAMYSSTAVINNVMVTTLTVPTATSDANAIGYGAGISFPKADNQGAITADNLSVFGFHSGFNMSSWATVGKMNATYCYVGLTFNIFYHPSIIRYFAVAYCAIVIDNPITTEPYPHIYIDMLDLGSYTNSGYFAMINTIGDPNNTLFGRIGYFVRDSGLLPYANDGGLNLEYINLAPDIWRDEQLQFPTVKSTSGTTAGTVLQKRIENGANYKKYMFTFSGYENDSTTDQTIDFITDFTTVTAITFNNTGLTISTTTSGITITAPDSTTTYSGIVIIEGY